MKSNTLILFTSFSFLLIVACSKQTATIKPVNLKCENSESPLGIDTPTPVFSWMLTSDNKNQRQTAYQIIVSYDIGKTDNNRGSVWDSGKILSGKTLNIEYEGKDLLSGVSYSWKVRVWDNKGVQSEWSKSFSFTMGLLDSDEWRAKWIGEHEDLFPDSSITFPAPYFRKSFNLKDRVQSAKLYVSGLGFYELYINGQKIGDQVLSPAQTNYDRRSLNDLLYYYDDQSTQRVLYNTFDVANKLTDGNNVVGVILGNGWYNQRDRTVEGKLWYSTPRLILQMEITDVNGQKVMICSDESWKVKTGPVLHDGIFTGIVYDARLELGEWNMPGYDDSEWERVKVVRAPVGKLVSQLAPSDKLIRSFHPIAVSKTEHDSYLYDAGEMITGWINFRVKGRRGTEIQIRHIEELGRDYGQIDTFILSGEGTETFKPRFTWHAFRTFEITGITEPLALDDIEIEVINTDVKRVSKFECSNQLYNTIYENYIRTQSGNFHGSISTDCPHRERLGYTGDGQVIVESSIFNFDMTNFYQKWFNDMDDARNKKTGYVPHTAPFGGGGGGPAWGSAYVIMPWNYYLYYNDMKILERHYDGMKQWIQYLGTRCDNSGIIVREEPNGWCLGDWATPDKIEVPESLVNTCYYYYVTDIMSKTASVLDKDEDEALFEDLAIRIKNDFNTHFFDEKTGNYWEGRQGANIFPLAFGMVPENKIPKLIENIVASIKQNNDHLDTGILGTPLLLEVLTHYGYADLAFDIMNQHDFPGFGYYIIGKNATTLWENWNGNGSHSHPMYGSVVAWFFKSLAGINHNTYSKDLTHFNIKPIICGDLEYVKAEYNSLYGYIISEWKIENGEARFIIQLPVNTSATICLPSNTAEMITKSSSGEEENNGTLSKEIRDDMTIFEIGSGKYQFVVPNFEIPYNSK